jgi:8-oxo-dGTP pyrophosphatase MutT (NUDIX family)
MELNSELITTPPRAAATVVMLRDSPSPQQGTPNLEVFLLKRHSASQVLGGAFVFPGGKVDAADAQLDMAAHLDQSPQALHAGLNEPEIEPLTAASFYVAAIREAFEECGILFAQGATAQHVAEAGALLKQGHSFGKVLAQLKLRLHSTQLLPWSRWITPQVPSVTNKRFDTRFFIACVPPSQIACHDDFETVESVWLSPRVALEQYWAGQIELAPPQIMSLASLSRHASVASVLQAARGCLPPVIAPEPFDEDGLRVICYPGDARHSVRTQAFAGPTRLVFRNKRFEPIKGFESLFED